MTLSLVVAIILFVLLPLVAGLLFMRAIQNWRLARGWSQVAETLDLQLDQASVWERPYLHGELDEHPVEVGVGVDEHGEHDQPYTWYQLELLEPPPTLLHMYSLTGNAKRGDYMIDDHDMAWSKVGNREEVEPPREEIDSRAWAKASDVSRARTILDNDELENAVTSVFSSEYDSHAALHDGTLYYREHGLATDARGVRSTLSDLATLADVVERRVDQV